MSTLTDRLQKNYQIIAQTEPQPVTVEFGPWLPDLPALGNPGATVARNVIPAKRSYLPVGSLMAASDALAARALAAVRARDSTGNFYNYAADAAALYEIRSSGVTDKSKAGGYTTPGETAVEFAQWRDQLVSTNYGDPVQVITVGSAGLFADLFTSTERPKAKHAAVINQFLVVGNINSTADGVVPCRINWSAFGDILDMDPNSQTQSDFEDRPHGGEIQAIVGHLQYGLVIQETAVVRMTYAGGAEVFQFDRIDRQRGTPVPLSVISHGRFTYFLSEEGFYVNDGTQSYPIGDGMVDKTLWRQFEIQSKHLMSAAVDPLNKLVAWAFLSSGGVGKIFFYYWPDRKWSEAEIECQILANTTSEALSLEDLDAIYASLEAMDAAGVTLDSAQFKGGGLLFGCFNTDNKLAYFDGSNLKATLETGESELFAGRYAKIVKLRPLVDGGDLTAAVAGRNRLVDAAVYDAAFGLDAIGEVGVKPNEARYHRFRCEIAAGGTWEHAQGVQVLATPMGSMGFP